LLRHPPPDLFPYTTLFRSFAGYPLLQSTGRYGDEAIAHRLALPRKAVVATDPDRLRAARALRSGYGASVLVLDDGWEQDRLGWRSEEHTSELQSRSDLVCR